MKVINTAEFNGDEATELERLCVYNGLDCCLTQELKEKLIPQMDHWAWKTYRYQMALQGPILDMMWRGLRVNLDQRSRQRQALEQTQAKLQEILNKLSIEVMGMPLNPQSPKQCAELFYQVLNLPPVYAKGKKNPTTDNQALESLKQYFYARPFCNIIIQYRDIGKLLATLKAKLGPDQRMYGKFSVAGTETGRLSASKSNFGEGLNLQNQTERVKRMYVADPGMKLAYIDLEQAESRIVGLLAYALFGESNYLDACESEDLHTTVCRMVWPELAWTGNIKEDRHQIADQIFFRHFSYRDMAKRGGHGCLTADHEVLTPGGWVSIAEKPPVIMGWNPETEKMQWEEPSHWEDKPWNGDMYEIRGNQYSMYCTSDHRMPVFTRQGKFNEKPAEQLFSVSSYNLKQFGVFKGGKANVTPLQARLHAAYSADGARQKANGIRWALTKERKQKRLEDLLLGYNPVVNKTDRGETTYHLSSAKVDFPLIKEAGPWMLEWPLESLKAWVEELPFWDGTQQRNFTWIYGKSRWNMDWMRTICILVGQSASYCNNYGHNCARVGLNRRTGRRIGSLKIQKKAGNGIQVYCPTVPSSGFLYRHNSEVGFSLNTNYYGQPFAMAKNLNVEKVVMEAFQQKYFTAFPEIQRWHEWTRRTIQQHGQLITPFGRKRIFFSRTDQDSTLREAIAYIPQSAIGDLMNLGMLKVWKRFRADEVQLLAQVHDAILIQYPEDREDEIIPKVLATIPHPLYARGREVIIPCEAETGFNWAKADPKRKFYADGNPDGLVGYHGHDPRVRQEIVPKKQSLLATTRVY